MADPTQQLKYIQKGFLVIIVSVFNSCSKHILCNSCLTFDSAFDQSSLEMDYDDGKRSKKRKCNQEEEHRTNWLDLIPREVGLDIISRLPMKSLIQSRFVCKIWQNLTYDPHLVGMHLTKSLKGNPYLIFHCDFPIKNQLYFVEISNYDDDDTEQEKVGKIDAPFSASMPEFNVIGSCNGILCLENSLFVDSLYLYNPFTMDYTELPKSTVFQDQQVMYGFGFHPITNQYKLIKIVCYGYTYDMNAIITPNGRYMVNRNLKSDAQIFSLGSKKWRSIGRVPYRFDRRSSAVLLNGRLHWTTNNFLNNGGDDPRLIVSFDISDEIFREVPGVELRNWLSRRNYHLAVLGGCLCVAAPVAANCGTLDIWIMKEYDKKESWVKEFSIGVYSPTNLRNRELERSYGIWRNVLTAGRLVRVVCLLKNGEILLEYKGGTLVSYNPETGMFKNITFQGVPNPTKTILHVGSLNRVDAPS